MASRRRTVSTTTQTTTTSMQLPLMRSRPRRMRSQLWCNMLSIGMISSSGCVRFNHRGALMTAMNIGSSVPAWFNHARRCSRHLLALKPTLQSWVPHTACFVTTRQIVALGDPSRSFADACESIGVVVKEMIKHLTRRRRIGSCLSRHVGSKTVWEQQIFKEGMRSSVLDLHVCVRSRLLHGESNLR